MKETVVVLLVLGGRDPRCHLACGGEAALPRGKASSLLSGALYALCGYACCKVETRVGRCRIQKCHRPMSKAMASWLSKSRLIIRKAMATKERRQGRM